MGGLGGSSEQQYSLRWNDFHSSILSSFRHLRDEEDFVDVTLACDGCSFTAHKVVLSACSPYFRTLLKANPCQHPIVILRDVREQDMEALLRFMYNGEVHIGQEQLTDFLKTAQTLQVRGLADVPTKEQQKLLTGGNPNAVAWMNNNNNINSNNSNENTRGGSPAGSLGLVGAPPSGGDVSRIGSPPIKRSRSSDLGSSALPNRFSPSPASSGNTNNHQTSGAGQLEMRESLLSQALESSHNSISSNNHQIKGNSDSSVHAQSTGEESNSSDTALSERGLSVSGNGPHSISDLTQPKAEPPDYLGHPDHHTNSSVVMDPTRQPNFPAALLGLQGLPGLLPGPSGMHGSGPDNSFDDDEVTGYVCPLCASAFPDLHTIRSHIDRHYPRDSPACPVPLCGRLFSHPNSVRNHMREKHSRIWHKMKSLKWTHVVPPVSTLPYV